MSDDPNIDAELPPAESGLADRLTSERPIPAAGFRGRLGRHLAARDPGYGPRPERLRLKVAGLLGTGTVLVALGALTAVGAL
ncbi:MAG TPA: hypothetical protein VGL51_11265 [Solirubrobacteraceae bacterium]